MELTRTLAANIVKTQYEDIPVEAREATKKSILDTLAVMFPSTTQEAACAAMAEIVKETGGGIEESTLVGFRGKVSCLQAAYLNGSLAHPMDFDDVLDSPPFHPTANTFPAALAVAEKIQNISGKDFITAVALGNDVSIRMVKSITGRLLDDYVWFPMSAFGIFSAAVASGKLLKLSEDEMVNALGIAFHRVCGVTKAIADPSSDLRAIRDGFTNQDGVLSALMAQKGIRACQDSIERFFKIYYRDEYDPQELLLNLGKEFRGAEVSLKIWSSARETNGYIQAALEIARENNIEPDQVKEVMLTVGDFNRDVMCEPLEVKRSPKSGIGAKCSLPFTVSLALTKKNVQITHFLPENLGDPEVLEMAKKVNYKHDPSFGPINPAFVEISTTDGKSFSKRVDTIYGHPQNPANEKDLLDKFRDCIRYAKVPFTPEQVEKLIGKVLHLEEVAEMQEVGSLLNGEA